MKIESFTPNRRAHVVELLNEAISGRRAASTVGELDFQRRVLDHPGFDSGGLLLAVNDAGRAIGFAHAIVPPVHLADYSRLAGRGFVIGPFVSAAWSGCGTGHGLLLAAEDYLRGRCERIEIHGLRTPFYHVQEGPRQPFCGSTEMMGLCADDAHLLAWLARAGYVAEAEQEVSMVAPLGGSPETAAPPGGMQVVEVTEEHPWRGTVAWQPSDQVGYGYEAYGPCRYHTIALADGDTIQGHCQWYPMRRPGRVALFDLRLDPALRGRGIGRFLLLSGLKAMAGQGYREVELHTSPQRNAVAYGMYRSIGFVEAANWIVMEKQCSA